MVITIFKMKKIDTKKGWDAHHEQFINSLAKQFSAKMYVGDIV